MSSLLGGSSRCSGVVGTDTRWSRRSGTVQSSLLTRRLRYPRGGPRCGKPIRRLSWLSRPAGPERSSSPARSRTGHSGSLRGSWLIERRTSWSRHSRRLRILIRSWRVGSHRRRVRLSKRVYVPVYSWGIVRRRRGCSWLVEDQSRFLGRGDEIKKSRWIHLIEKISFELSQFRAVRVTSYD